jgi:hypothetical protein
MVLINIKSGSISYLDFVVFYVCTGTTRSDLIGHNSEHKTNLVFYKSEIYKLIRQGKSDELKGFFRRSKQFAKF